MVPFAFRKGYSIHSKKTMEKQFTATVYILENDRVLLIYHKKMGKWLPPGGHMHQNELPAEAAKREALEETGLHIEIIPQENIWIKRWNASSIERPYLCLLEEIPAYGTSPAHQHIDFIYVGRPSGGEEIPHLAEVDSMRWFTAEEVQALTPDVEIFVETQETIAHLLKQAHIDTQDRKWQIQTRLAP